MTACKVQAVRRRSFEGESMTFQFRCAVLALGGAVPVAAQGASQPPADAQAIRQAIDELKKDFDARLSALEARLSAVEKSAQLAPPAAAPAPAPAEGAAAAAVAQPTAGAAGSSVTNA